MFLDAHASDARATATIGPTAAATTHRVAAIFGAPTADASEWDCSRNGENKSPSQPPSAAHIPAATIRTRTEF